MVTAPEKTGSHVCFDGDNTFYQHVSSSVGGNMNFTVYTPPQAKEKKLPVLLYLAGLTCDHTTFIIKGGVQRLAAKHGIILVAPDTSQRDKRYPGDADKYDFGIAAGFYVNATQKPWKDGYQMASYVSKELPELIEEHFPVDGTWGVFGHSMGGHGALTTALRNPERFKSVSAFAPIVAPSSCPWGEKALGNYLGPDKETWKEWDATELVKAGKTTSHILIDQGTADQFLAGELHPHLFKEACEAAGQPLVLRMQEGYDHSYYTMQTFMEDHFTHHAKVLGL
jgi:S-formylglutathione hydrolase